MNQPRPASLDDRVKMAHHVRELTALEWAAAFPLMSVLRPHLQPATFLDRLRDQIARGYRLAGALAGNFLQYPNQLTGLIGWREVHCFSRGGYLHIDDLIVSPEMQGSGVGRALMAYAEAQARATGLRALFLDARPAAIPFYEKLGLRLHPSPSMFVDLAPLRS